nr:ribonuclease H-like domain-containing protein [Tanacetum cinerariifolium]
MSDHEDETIIEENAHPKVVPQITTKFEEFKISEEEGLDKGYDKMQKILTQMNTLKIKPDPEDVNMKFLRGLPPSWSDQHLVYEDLDQMNNEEFKEYDLKH